MQHVLKKITLCSSILISFNSFALSDHYKNMLIGGRASTMGGAYHAISDDAAGAYYNPAGLALASSDSISGSAKVYNITNSKITDVFGANDWERKSANFLPNFFGMIKKNGKHSYGLSFIVSDSVIEHQDQIYYNITNLVNPISLYSYNLHLDETTSLFGLSYAYNLSKKFSLGLSAHYHNMVLRRNFHQHIEFQDTLEEISYQNVKNEERGIRLKAGTIYSASDKYSLGFAVAKTLIMSETTEWQVSQSTRTDTNATFSTGSSELSTNYPVEFSFGAAYFPSPFLLFAFDVDYVLAMETYDRDVINASFGLEYYLSISHAVRFGVFTNMTNNPAVSTETAAPNSDLNMYGGSIGYTQYSKDSSFTLGAIYSYGSGQMQVYTGSAEARDITKYSLSLVASAGYGF